MNEGTLSRGSMLAITLLRVFVGWHFLYEGIAKLSAPSWSAAGYLKQARGPFAEAFKWLAAQPNLLANADLITMYGLTIVGLLLVLGLFTRLAALGGIGFILLFYLCNPPFVGYFYSIPTEGSYLVVNKNLVELARAPRHPRDGQRQVRRARSHRQRPARPRAAPRDRLNPPGSPDDTATRRVTGLCGCHRGPSPPRRSALCVGLARSFMIDTRSRVAGDASCPHRCHRRGARAMP